VVDIAGAGPAIATVSLGVDGQGTVSGVLLLTATDGVVHGSGEGSCQHVTSHTFCTLHFVIDGGDGRFANATGTAQWTSFDTAGLAGDESISGQFDVPA